MENENNYRIARSSPNVESNPINETARANEVKKFTSPVNIHFHSLRHRLADPDGLSGKAVLDEIVKVGILSGDSTKEVKSVKFTQEKFGKDQEEKTIITIKAENE